MYIIRYNITYTHSCIGFPAFHCVLINRSEISMLLWSLSQLMRQRESYFRVKIWNQLLNEIWWLRLILSSLSTKKMIEGTVSYSVPEQNFWNLNQDRSFTIIVENRSCRTTPAGHHSDFAKRTLPEQELLPLVAEKNHCTSSNSDLSISNLENHLW